MSAPRGDPDGTYVPTRTLADEGLDDHDRRLLSDVQRIGWSVIRIPSEDDGPGWAFSVGLWRTFRHPEIVVFGLPLDVDGPIINLIGRRVQAGERFSEVGEHEGFLEGYRCTFRPVRGRWYRPFLGYAIWFYRGLMIPFHQCVWPDTSHRWPWQPGFKKEWLLAQPLLYEEEPEEARAVELLSALGEE